MVFSIVVFYNESMNKKHIQTFDFILLEIIVVLCYIYYIKIHLFFDIPL